MEWRTGSMTVRVSATKLVVEVDIDPATLHNAPQSKSGLTRLVASTQGFMPIPAKNGLSLNLNVTYRGERHERE